MSYPLGDQVAFFSMNPHGETQAHVVGQPWALEVTSFGLANPETNESGLVAQLKKMSGESRTKDPRS